MKKEFNKRIKISKILLVILLTLLSRFFLLYLTSQADHGGLSTLIRVDETGYIKEAGIIMKHGLLLLWNAPLYPIFLAAFFKVFGANYLLAGILNIILFSFAVGILYSTIAYFFNELRALITATILILYPTLLLNILLPTSEALYLFLLSCGFYTFLRYLKYENAASGRATAIILGLLTLTKETFVLFPVIIASIIIIRYSPDLKKPLKKILSLVFIYILMLLPLLIYNHQANGKFTLSKKTLRVIEALPADLGSINKNESALAKQGDPNMQIGNFFWERKRFFLGTGTFSLMRAFGYDSKRLELFADKPGGYFRLLKEYGRGWLIFQYSASFFIICVLFSSLLAMIMLAAKRKWKEITCFILIISYFFAAYSCRYNSRYFIVLVPFLALLSSYPYSVFYYYIKNRKLRT